MATGKTTESGKRASQDMVRLEHEQLMVDLHGKQFNCTDPKVPTWILPVAEEKGKNYQSSNK